jgi:hypothetical protein
MMRRLLFIIASVIVSASATMPAAAAVKKAATTTKTAAKTKATTPAVDPKVTLEKLRTKGEAEVQRRFDKLNGLYKQLADGNKLDVASKQTFGSSMQAEATSLGQLKDKIHVETDLTAMRADIRSLVDEFSTYHGLLMQAAVLASASSTADTGARLLGATTRLNQALSQAGDNGKDVTALQARVQAAVDRLATVDASYRTISQDTFAASVKSPAATFAAQRDKLKADRATLGSVSAELTAIQQSVQSLGANVEL